MKKLFLILILLLTLTSCTSELYKESMKDLDKPITIPIKQGDATIDVWVTKYKIIALTQEVYYAPKSVQVNGVVHTNAKEAYYICYIAINSYDSIYKELSNSDLRKIFGG